MHDIGDLGQLLAQGLLEFAGNLVRACERLGRAYGDRDEEDGTTVSRPAVKPKPPASRAPPGR